MRPAAVFLLAGLLAGAAAEDDLALGIRQVREGDFEGAILTLDGVVRGLAGQASRRAELVQARVQLATAQLGLDQREPARSSLREALRLDPELRLSPESVSPKLVGLLAEVRKELQAAQPPARGSRTGLWLLGVGGATAGVVALASAGGSAGRTDPAVSFGNAQFDPAAIVCPDGVHGLPLTVAIQLDGFDSGATPVTVSSVAADLTVIASSIAEVGLRSSGRPTTVSPGLVLAGGRASLRVETSLVCDNDRGDPPRWNEWSGRVTLTTSAGGFSVDTLNRLHVEIP